MVNQQKFEEYCKENPEVYAQFKVLALMGIQKGAKKLGAKQICEVIRWYSIINHNDKYKVNNSFISGLARKFEKEFPIHQGIFNKRSSKIVIE